MQNIYWFKEISKGSLSIAGGKGANLGEMTNAGFPIPPGFVVSAETYFDFIKRAGIEAVIKIKTASLDVEDGRALQLAGEELKGAILAADVPSDIRADILRAYNKLCGVDFIPTKADEILVAVRSSATAEDLPEASFAGQQATFLDVQGGDAVVDAVRRCWASLFEPRAIYYRKQNHFDDVKVGIAVIIQKMVQSEKSGVMFSVDPVSGDTNKLVIEAGFGLGEAIVSGMITPDRYLVDKASMQIIDKKINKQQQLVMKSGKTTATVDVPEEMQEVQKATDSEILWLAEQGIKIEEHYGAPQDMEWAIDQNGRYIVQSRAITTLNKKPAQAILMPMTTATTSEEKELLRGMGASPGVGIGPVRIVSEAKDIYKVKKGDILVAKMTSPDYVPAMKRAAAIVTDEGGSTCHAAIVSRELGIPAIVGTSHATAILKEDQIVTVDANQGVVFDGALKREDASEERTEATAQGGSAGFATGTKIYVNLAEPELAEGISKKDVDGVGLLRAEFMIAAIGVHPKKLIKENRQQEFIDSLAKGLRKVCAAFNGKPVIYRATDFKTNEYRNLEGGAEFEPQEENPMIGYRGCFRYVKDPEVFKLELAAIRKVREQYGLRNLWLMIPVVRTIHELRICKKIMEDSGLHQNNDFKFGIMCEVPANVILADEFCKEGIDFMSVGSNDLTQLTLGVDRDSPTVAEEFDERDLAIRKSLERVAKACHENNVKLGCCGQAPSVYPEFAEMLVEFGFDSISANPDVIEKTRKIVASAEMKILLKRNRENK